MFNAQYSIFNVQLKTGVYDFKPFAFVVTGRIIDVIDALANIKAVQ